MRIRRPNPEVERNHISDFQLLNFIFVTQRLINVSRLDTHIHSKKSRKKTTYNNWKADDTNFADLY